jgi:polysaccharide pyruvyl transferase WcaK-like protein
VLIGGGGLFGPEMGRIGRLLPAYGLTANLLGRTTVLEGVDVDERMPVIGRALLRTLVSRSARASFRDDASVRAVKGWGLDAVLTPDLSSRMAPAPASVGVGLLRQAGIEPGRPVIGLSLTAVDSGLGDRVLAATAAVMERYPEAQFCFIPMSRHPFVPRHNDVLLAQRLRQARPELRILGGDHHPGAILSAFGALDAAICMRYHSLLFARRSGVLMVPVVYAEKCRRWLEAHDIAPVAPTAAAITDALAEVLPAARLAS